MKAKIGLIFSCLEDAEKTKAFRKHMLVSWRTKPDGRLNQLSNDCAVLGESLRNCQLEVELAPHAGAILTRLMEERNCVASLREVGCEANG